MKITRITVWALDLPLTQPYWLSGGRLKFECFDSTFVRIDTDAGVSGWGEVCPIPHYLPAYAQGVRPALIGGDPLGAEALMTRADAWLQGHVCAKSALDIALWDIPARWRACRCIIRSAVLHRTRSRAWRARRRPRA